VEIKTSLKKLMSLFAQAVNDEELPVSERSFAGKNMILVAHTQRIEKKFDTIIAAQDKQIAELASVVMLLRQGNAQPPAAPAPDAATGELPPKSEEDEAQEMADRVLAETLEEERLAAQNAAKNGGATVTPLRPNGEPATPAGEAS